MQGVPETQPVEDTRPARPSRWRGPHLFVVLMARALQAPKWCVPITGRINIGMLYDGVGLVPTGPGVLGTVDGVPSLLLPDSGCSKEHAQLHVEADVVKIVARNKKEEGKRQNGTVVHRKGRSIPLPIGEEVDLKDLDVIEIGHTFLLYRSDTEAVMYEMKEPADREPTMATFVPVQKVQYGLLGKSARPLFVEGETGTGKEIAAGHQGRILRGDTSPFIAKSCANLNASTFEVEVFGTEKGSFSGVDTRMGLFEQADGGTLFFDEIAEASAEVQGRLLRVIDYQVITRLGGKARIPVDVALVFATLDDVEKKIGDGKFRADLWQRINGQRIKLLPLRERREDLGMILAAILRSEEGGSTVTLHVEVARAFMTYHWPGNIRELANVVVAGVRRLAGAREIDLGDLPEFAANYRKQMEPAATTVTPRAEPVAVASSPRPLSSEDIEKLNARGGDFDRADLERWLRAYGGAAGLLDLMARPRGLKDKIYRSCKMHGINPRDGTRKA